MSDDRDPRHDPEPGDGVSRNFKRAINGIILRDVSRAHGGFVFFTQDNGYRAKRRIVSLAQWRKWARLGEVYGKAEKSPRF